MTYLVDANVLSEATKPVPEEKVIEWLSTHEENFVVDSIIFGELFLGILALPAGRKRTQLEQWFAAVVEATDCLAWDTAASRCWAELVTELKRKGQMMPVLDGMIAATARAHDLILVTRNTLDFKKARIKLFNPFV